MPRPPDPNARNIPVTIKVNRSEERVLKGLAPSSGKGLRLVLNRYLLGRRDFLKEEQ